MVIFVICAIASFAQAGSAVTIEPPAGSLSEGPIDGMVFAWIPSGSFSMGDSTIIKLGSFGIASPVHTVTIMGFEMMTTEVTQGMWLDVMGSNPSWFTGDPGLPVEQVSWFDCQAFLDSLNSIDPSHSYRLPSEAEWEYACRAGTVDAFYWGSEMDYDYCCYLDGSGDSTSIVGQRIPNAWGLYDMSGNVSEWCQDTWKWGGYCDASADGDPWLGEGDSRIARGGSWFPSDIEENSVFDCRSGDRKAYEAAVGCFTIGFRVARSDR